MKTILLSTAAMLVSLQCFANMEQQGLSGELSVMAGYSSGKSNFDTDNKTKEGELNSPGGSESNFVPLALGQLRYTFSDNQIFIGTAKSDIVSGVLALEAGYKRAVGQNSSIAFSYLPTIMERETFADPYVTGSERDETDVTGDAYRLRYKNMLNTGLTADIAYFTREIDDELSGSTSYSSYQSQLKRGGDGLHAKLNGTLFVAPGFMIHPAVLMEDYSADGNAMSYTKYGGELRFMLRGKHTYVLTLGYAESEHDQTNPIFNEIQKDEELKAVLSYNYSGLMGWDSLGLSTLVSYSQSDSNIDFYDKENALAAVGVSFRF
ncbi:DUF2860 domain-containing protein [Vibrio sp. JC009]|uniref:DUF2860 family protein n=1 Tax=Vibrio sp. JC009 TaxID=2912314 RepID=UPI0023AF285F|nr:DUF2860 family protein [Vibrio sp. JC009]WED23852.1 DUF2860 domain-containing protein [Vibrio sp. JC009]